MTKRVRLDLEVAVSTGFLFADLASAFALEAERDFFISKEAEKNEE